MNIRLIVTGAAAVFSLTIAGFGVYGTLEQRRPNKSLFALFGLIVSVSSASAAETDSITPELLGDLSKVIPADISILSLKTDGPDLVIEGRARSLSRLSEFMQLLGRSARLAPAKLVKTVSLSSDSLRFQIKAARKLPTP